MKIKIYTTPVCPWCQMAKDFFKEHQLEFEEIDVSQNLEAAREMIQKSGQTGVPVIEIGDKVISGFNRPLIEEILGLGNEQDKQQK
ncbi:MAG TPA: glutaredoxin family protein [Candidatus Paceibacterota bacterium]|jgi:glutaredoxin-like YruB-family protein|nr:glutaredoxin family protein [Candidatus Paceibacterota bacterium]HOQ15218.1 glutaredoxin family protein [Candidatus Paceibacterota bacterium]HPQ22772.1 glutaredoxin family protein [Candidatus Paceibacterota bacterium]HRR45740.1 glutaredoxin family protein [Candidatus Paceibacterota bacterium]